MCAVTSGFFRSPKLRCSGCWDTLSTELLPHSVFFFLRCTNLNHTFCCLFFSFFIVTSWKRTAFFSICLAGEIPKTRVLDRVLWRTRTNRINTCLVWEYGSARKHSLSFPELDFPSTECPALPSPRYTEFSSRAAEFAHPFLLIQGGNSPVCLCGQTLQPRGPGHSQTCLLIGKNFLNAGSGTPGHNATPNCWSPVLSERTCAGKFCQLDTI